jgi:neural Wiskott-Aldrich syndrome protein
MQMSQSFAEALSWVPKSRDLAVTLARAHDYARAQGHRVVTLEHLLLALVADGDASRVLQACNVDSARLNTDASTYLLGLMSHALPEQVDVPGADPNFLRILDYATAAAQQSRRSEVNGAIVLAAIVGDGGSAAAAMLRAQGLTFEEAIKGLQRATGSSPIAGPPSPLTVAEPVQRASSRDGPATPGPSPGPHESSYPKSPRPPASADPVVGAWGPSTEEILAVARQRVEAGLTSVAKRPDQTLVGEGQAGTGPQPQVELWPSQPAMPALSLRETLVNPHPQAISKSVAQTTAGPLVDKVGASADPRDIASRPAAPPLDWTREANSVPPGAPPAGSQIPALETVFPSYPGSLALHPQPVPPMRSSGAPVSPPPLRMAVEAPSARVPQPSLAAAPPHGKSPPTQAAYAPPPGHVDAAVPMPDPRRDFDFDGNFAGPPYLAPDEPARLPAGAAARAAPAAATRRRAPATAGRLVENFPRTVQIGKPKTVEVRIDKASVQALAEGLQGGGTAYPHDIIITNAMSLRLRAPNGGFWIETASPETQWIENTLGPLTDDFVSWRWTVTAQRRGRLRLQLIISARTVGADGLATETALQDQTIEVRVRANYGQLASRWAGWVAAALVGGALTRFGEDIWNAGRAALDRLSGV